MSLAVLHNKTRFSKLVVENYDHKLSVHDFAKKLNYSISGFEKRFKKTFNMTPMQWMQNQKAQAIYYEITCDTKSFNKLALEYGFSSAPHFHNFCKKIFNKTPGSIRKKHIPKLLSSEKVREDMKYMEASICIQREKEKIVLNAHKKNISIPDIADIINLTHEQITKILENN